MASCNALTSAPTSMTSTPDARIAAAESFERDCVDGGVGWLVVGEGADFVKARVFVREVLLVRVGRFGVS
ncbi:hypothetical protein BGX38DRAFT_1189722 [Terfezia claveryi]|nr:hypothetical protein BGX38DRAFT_1189722 [Terfezia claveryi]